MPHEDPVAEVTRQWLKGARGDLALAKVEKPPLTPWELLCFHAQQAAEKGFKAVLVHFQVDFPKTHSIEDLIDILEGNGHPVPKILKRAAGLTSYAVGTRYPFDGGDKAHKTVAQSDLRRAIEIAETVVDWAETQLCKPRK
jgi:HEPN domain-containing protein